MDEYSFEHRTNATFVATFTLDAWCDLYDFTLGHWHAMLRKQVDSAIAHYEWSTEDGNLVYSETRAHGELTFTLNPELGDTLMIGATIIEFGPTDGVEIGPTLAATMASLLAYLEASEDVDVLKCSYSVTSGSVLNITYGTAGSLGNVFPFDTDVAGTTASGETLTGGGGMITLTAPVEDVGVFTGDYYYDVRWQVSSPELFVPVVGGVITFGQGVTRDVAEPET